MKFKQQIGTDSNRPTELDVNRPMPDGYDSKMNGANRAVTLSGKNLADNDCFDANQSRARSRRAPVREPGRPFSHGPNFFH
ncbi:MAG: hypothetical protein HY302_02580 [Opitutae bacterium]|nr:hypothetical protein [Opitutae bacterium]